MIKIIHKYYSSDMSLNMADAAGCSLDKLLCCAQDDYTPCSWTLFTTTQKADTRSQWANPEVWSQVDQLTFTWCAITAVPEHSLTLRLLHYDPSQCEEPLTQEHSVIPEHLNPNLDLQDKKTDKCVLFCST